MCWLVFLLTCLSLSLSLQSSVWCEGTLFNSFLCFRTFKLLFFVFHLEANGIKSMMDSIRNFLYAFFLFIHIAFQFIFICLFFFYSFWNGVNLLLVSCMTLRFLSFLFSKKLCLLWNFGCIIACNLKFFFSCLLKKPVFLGCNNKIIAIDKHCFELKHQLIALLFSFNSKLFLFLVCLRNMNFSLFIWRNFIGFLHLSYRLFHRLFLYLRLFKWCFIGLTRCFFALFNFQNNVLKRSVD